MRIHELFEQIDPREAEQVLRSLRANNDPAAKYFAMTSQNPLHTTIDSAQRAAEQMARADLDKISQAERRKIERDRQELRKQAQVDDQSKKADKKASKSGFKGPSISDTGKELKGFLGKVQKAFKSGTQIADKYTKATKS